MSDKLKKITVTISSELPFVFDGGNFTVQDGILYLYEDSPSLPFAVFKTFDYVIQEK